MKRAAQNFLFLACVLFSIAAAYNVMSDNAGVVGMALASACHDGGPNCHAEMTRMERTPFSQTFEFVTPKRKVEVRCARALVMVGEYTCALR
jgi:hypothetical protein